MIENDDQLDVTLQRICYFAKTQAGIRTTATPSQFASMSGGYLSEIEKMWEEVIEYLSSQDDEPERTCRLESCGETQPVT